MLRSIAEPLRGGRSPCGERGLKYGVLLFRARSPSSLPVRGAWIEILARFYADIRQQSLPVRGAWIEIDQYIEDALHILVAPRAGSVD